MRAAKRRRRERKGEKDLPLSLSNVCGFRGFPFTSDENFIKRNGLEISGKRERYKGGVDVGGEGAIGH